MRRRLIAFLLVACAMGGAVVGACTSFDAEPNAGLDGGASDSAINGPDGSPVDGPSDAGADGASSKCRWDAPFTASGPVLGDINTEKSDLGPRLTPDELTLVFHRDEGVKDTIFVAKRPNLAAPFAVSGPLALYLSAGVSYAHASLSREGTTLYVDSNRNGSRDIWFAQRGNPSLAFESPSVIPSLSRVSELEAEPFIAGSELFLTYQDGTSISIWVSKLDGLGGYGPRITVPGITADAGGNRGHATLSADGLTMYFAQQGTDYDIWAARRSAIGAPFGPPTKMTGAVVNSAATEAPGWISDDECRLYFATLRNPARGYEIWVAERAP